MPQIHITQGNDSIVKKPIEYVVFEPVRNKNDEPLVFNQHLAIREWEDRLKKRQTEAVFYKQARPKKYKGAVFEIKTPKRVSVYNESRYIPDTLYNEDYQVNSEGAEDIKNRRNKKYENMVRELKIGVKNEDVRNSLKTPYLDTSKVVNVIYNAIKGEVKEPSYLLSLVEQRYTQGELYSMSRFPSLIKKLIRENLHLIDVSTDELPENFNSLSDLEKSVIIEEMVSIGYQRIADEFVKLLTPIYASSALQGKNNPATYESQRIGSQLLRSNNEPTIRYTEDLPVPDYGNKPETVETGEKPVLFEDETEEEVLARERKENELSERERMEKEQKVPTSEEEPEGPSGTIKSQRGEEVVKPIQFDYPTRSVRDYEKLFDFAVANQGEYSKSNLRRITILGEVIKKIHSTQGNISYQTFNNNKKFSIKELNVLWLYLVAREQSTTDAMGKLFFSSVVERSSKERGILISEIIDGLLTQDEVGDAVSVEGLKGEATIGFGIKKLNPKKKNTLTKGEKKALRKAGNDSI